MQSEQQPLQSLPPRPPISSIPQQPISAMEVNKSNNKLLPIICIIFALAGIGFGVYGIVSRPTQEEISLQPESQQSEVYGEESGQKIDPVYVGFDDAKAESLIDKYAIWSWGGIKYSEELMTDLYKWYITFQEPELARGTLSLKENGCEKDGNGDVYVYSYEEANIVYKKLFGSTSSLPKVKNFACGAPQYIDDSTIKYACGCGGAGPKSDVVYQNYNIDGDELTIAVINIIGSDDDYYGFEKYDFIFKPDNGNIVLTAINKR